MDITRDIHPLSEFKKNASKLIKQARETKRSIILTVNGQPAAVIQDPETYQEMMNAQEYERNLRVLRKSLKSVDSGVKMRTAEEFFAEFSQKYGVSFDDIEIK
jgi:prevent-host-death family protein